MQIFISHSSIDKLFVRKLKKELENNHLNVWLDEVEIRVGQSITEEVSNALLNSEVFCFIMSSNAEKSGWVSREYNSKLPLIISGQACLVPCRLDDSKIPNLIADIKYADFRSSFQKGIEEILNAIKIREEINSQKHLQNLKTQLLNTLNKEDIALFAYYFSKTGIFLDDNKFEPNFEKLINVLSDLHVLEFKYEKYIGGDGDLYYYYQLSKIGKEIHKEIMKIADSSLINQYEVQQLYEKL